MAMADEYHGDVVPLEEREGRVRIANSVCPILLHGVYRDGALCQAFVHSHQDKLVCCSRGLQIPFEPSQLIMAKSFMPLANIIQGDKVYGIPKICGVGHLINRGRINAGGRKEILLEFFNCVLTTEDAD